MAVKKTKIAPFIVLTSSITAIDFGPHRRFTVAVSIDREPDLPGGEAKSPRGIVVFHHTLEGTRAVMAGHLPSAEGTTAVSDRQRDALQRLKGSEWLDFAEFCRSHASPQSLYSRGSFWLTLYEAPRSSVVEHKTPRLMRQA